MASLAAVLAAPNVELKMELEQMEASLLQLTARVLAQLAPLLQIITIFSKHLLRFAKIQQFYLGYKFQCSGSVTFRYGSGSGDSYCFCLMMELSGSVPLTKVSGSESGRSKYMRIRNTGFNTVKIVYFQGGL